jgi:hypothetical protein
MVLGFGFWVLRVRIWGLGVRVSHLSSLSSMDPGSSVGEWALRRVGDLKDPGSDPGSEPTTLLVGELGDVGLVSRFSDTVGSEVRPNCFIAWRK